MVVFKKSLHVTTFYRFKNSVANEYITCLEKIATYDFFYMARRAGFANLHWTAQEAADV
jgi:hypothetical protein